VGFDLALADGFAAALASAAFAVDFAAAGLADVDLPAADLAEVLPAGLDAVALAAGCLDAAGFAGAAFAAGLAAADFACAGLAAILAVDFVAGFDAAGFEVLVAVGFAAALFAAAEAGLAAAFACLAALGGFVVPVFVGFTGLDDASAGFAFGAAVLFVVLANFASLGFPSPDFYRLQPPPRSSFARRAPAAKSSQKRSCRLCIVTKRWRASLASAAAPQ